MRVVLSAQVSVLAAIGIAAGLAFIPDHAEAGGWFSRDDRGASKFSRHQKSDYYRGRPQVRGYRRRVGGYSYGRQDSRFFGIAPRIKFGVEPNYATLPSSN